MAAGAGGAEAWLVASGRVHAVASTVTGTLASGAPAEIIASPFTAAAASFRGFFWYVLRFALRLLSSFLFCFHLKMVSEQLHGNEERADVVCCECFSKIFFKGTPVEPSWHNRA